MSYRGPPNGSYYPDQGSYRGNPGPGGGREGGSYRGNPNNPPGSFNQKEGYCGSYQQQNYGNPRGPDPNQGSYGPDYHRSYQQNSPQSFGGGGGSYGNDINCIPGGSHNREEYRAPGGGGIFHQQQTPPPSGSYNRNENRSYGGVYHQQQNYGNPRGPDPNQGSYGPDYHRSYQQNSPQSFGGGGGSYRNDINCIPGGSHNREEYRAPGGENFHQQQTPPPSGSYNRTQGGGRSYGGENSHGARPERGNFQGGGSTQNLSGSYCSPSSTRKSAQAPPSTSVIDSPSCPSRFSEQKRLAPCKYAESLVPLEDGKYDLHNSSFRVSFTTCQDTVVQQHYHDSVDNIPHTLSVLQRVKESQMSGILLPNSYHEENGKLFVLYDSIFSTSKTSVEIKRPYSNAKAFKEYAEAENQPIPPSTLLEILISASQGYRNLFRIFKLDRADNCPLDLLISLDMWFLQIIGSQITVQVAGVQNSTRGESNKSQPGQVIREFGEAALELLGLDREDVEGPGPAPQEKEALLEACKDLLASCFQERVLDFGYELISKFFYDFNQKLGANAKKIKSRAGFGGAGGWISKRETKKKKGPKVVALPTFDLTEGQRETFISGLLTQAFKGNLWKIDNDDVLNYDEMEKLAILLVDTPSDRFWQLTKEAFRSAFGDRFGKGLPIKSAPHVICIGNGGHVELNKVYATEMSFKLSKKGQVEGFLFPGQYHFGGCVPSKKKNCQFVLNFVPLSVRPFVTLLEIRYTLGNDTVPCAYFPLVVESVTEISACNYWNVPQDFFTLDESEHLGEGAFGEVKIIEIWGQKIAAKVMKSEKMLPDTDQKGQKEAMMLFRDSRPKHITLTYGMNFNPKTCVTIAFMPICPYNLAQFFIKGKTTDKFWDPNVFGSIQKAKDRVKLTFQVLLQVAQGIKSMHDVGVYHGDLKPANLLMTQRGVVKLCDFGSIRHSYASANPSLRGTFPYMAPEVYANTRGQTRITKASDLFSFGIILYELLFGKQMKIRYESWEALENGETEPSLDKHSFFRTEWDTVYKGCVAPDANKRLSIEKVVTLLEKEMKGYSTFEHA